MEKSKSNLENPRKRRNVLIVSGIVAGIFMIIHMIVTFYSHSFNIIYSVMGAAIFFFMYFFFQLIRNAFIDKNNK